MLSNISAVLSYCKVVFEVTRERRRDLRSRASIYISTVKARGHVEGCAIAPDKLCLRISTTLCALNEGGRCDHDAGRASDLRENTRPKRGDYRVGSEQRDELEPWTSTDIQVGGVDVWGSDCSTELTIVTKGLETRT